MSDTSTAADRSRRKSQLPSRFRDAGEAPTQQQQSSNKTPQPRKPAAAGEAPGVGHGEQQEQALVSDTGGSADRGPGMPLSLGVAEAGGEKQQAPSNKLTPGSRSWAAVAAGKAGQAPPDLHAAGGSSSARAQQQRGGLRSQMSGGAAAAALEQQQPSSSQKPPLPRVHPAPAAAAAAAAAAGAGSSGPRSALPKADASVEQLKIFMDAVAGSTDADVLMCTTKAGEVLTSLQLPVLGVEDLGRMTAAVQEAAAEAGAALLLDGTEGDPISGASAVTAHTHLAFVHGVRTGCFISPFDSYEVSSWVFTPTVANLRPVLVQAVVALAQPMLTLCTCAGTALPASSSVSSAHSPLQPATALLQQMSMIKYWSSSHWTCLHLESSLITPHHISLRFCEAMWPHFGRTCCLSAMKPPLTLYCGSCPHPSYRLWVQRPTAAMAWACGCRSAPRRRTTTSLHAAGCSARVSSWRWRVTVRGSLRWLPPPRAAPRPTRCC